MIGVWNGIHWLDALIVAVLMVAAFAWAARK